MDVVDPSITGVSYPDRRKREPQKLLVPGGVFAGIVRNTSKVRFRLGLDHGDNIHEADGYAVTGTTT
jgi:hypothetical protein